MNVGVLTSSRADFGIYLPLLIKLRKDDFFNLSLIVFGTHLSKKHGFTVDEIIQHEFEIAHKVNTIPKGDSAQEIANSIGKTINEFSHFWSEHTFDLVFSFGDRYEMFAAVTASTPFNVTIAHIHAGETTLGAIDNAYRHSISLMSKYLFVSTEDYKKRAEEIVAGQAKVFNVGALSVDNLSQLKLYDKATFKQRYQIDLETPTILSTFHPETVSPERNKKFMEELLEVYHLLRKKYQIVITMPNADTMGDMIRKKLEQLFALDDERVHLVESFGMLGYISCMKNCSFLIGNTSSGFVEAAYFPKYVINIGDRQLGRLLTENIISTKIEKEEILGAVRKIEQSKSKPQKMVYGNGNTANQIIDILKRL